jgi:superfamily II DNA/RNA helicase
MMNMMVDIPVATPGRLLELMEEMHGDTRLKS